MDQQLEKYFNGSLNEYEKAVFLKEVISDERLKAAFIRQQNELALMSYSDAIINKEESTRHYQLFVQKISRKKRYLYIIRTLKYAAIFFLFLFSTYSLITQFFSSPLPNDVLSLYVPPGQRIHFTLQDGTEVWLNAKTRISYPAVFTGKERRVSIEGEGFFKVANIQNMPFVVTTNQADIQVLGTEFNVSNYPGEKTTKVSLLEGSLQVTIDSESKKEKVILKPDEEAIIENYRMLINEIPDNDYFMWREGIYSFTNEKLGEIFRKLELYYDIDIRVENSFIADWNYTVKFRQRDGIDEILRLLQRIHAFSVCKNEEKNMITIR